VKKVVEVSKIKKGGYIIVDEDAYKVTAITHSKAGKHGHGKYRIDAASVIGGKKTSVIMGAGHKIDVPIIDKQNVQVLTVEERVEERGKERIVKKIANVMDIESFETFDVEIPSELESEVKDGVKLLLWDVLGAKQMKQVVQ
jgi:translation initiation factor 5A